MIRFSNLFGFALLYFAAYYYGDWTGCRFLAPVEASFEVQGGAMILGTGAQAGISIPFPSEIIRDASGNIVNTVENLERLNTAIVSYMHNLKMNTNNVTFTVYHGVGGIYNATTVTLREGYNAFKNVTFKVVDGVRHVKDLGVGQVLNIVRRVESFLEKILGL